jgi:hypothetical protein
MQDEAGLDSGTGCEKGSTSDRGVWPDFLLAKFFARL